MTQRQFSPEENLPIVRQLISGEKYLSQTSPCGGCAEGARVNRRWYYQHQQQTSREQREAKLHQAMEEIILSFPRYGYRRVTHALLRAGWHIGPKRVLRIMRQHSWLCRSKRRTIHTTSSGIAIAAIPIW